MSLTAVRESLIPAKLLRWVSRMVTEVAVSTPAVKVSSPRAGRVIQVIVPTLVSWGKLRVERAVRLLRVKVSEMEAREPAVRLIRVELSAVKLPVIFSTEPKSTVEPASEEMMTSPVTVVQLAIAASVAAVIVKAAEEQEDWATR